MTELVIRALTESDAHLFDTLPDPLGLGRALAGASHRPDWKRVALRDGKVLVDWSQNSAAKTTVSVYSLRARPTPTVSTPVTWDEVEACRRPEDLVFTSDDVLARVEESGDLFAPLLG